MLKVTIRSRTDSATHKQVELLLTKTIM